MDGAIRILHVDDEPEIANLTATFLEREDDSFVVETATSVSEGLDRLTEGFDGIISDYDMPETDGLTFLQHVRETYPDLPFILFTGQGSEEIASDAISAGVTDYLQKGGGTDQYTVLANRMQNAVEQYRSNRALEASQKRLSLFIEQSPLGVLEYNEAFEIVRLNETGEEILGYSESELRGRSWETLVSDASYENVDAVTDALSKAEGGYHSIDENVRKDGEQIICEWHNRVITDDDGDVVAILSQFQEITEREENRQRLEAAIDNLPGLVYRCRNEADWPLELVRGSCEELTGYSASEFLEEVRRFERIIHRDDVEYVTDGAKRGLATDGAYELTYRIVRKDGEIRWVWERGKLVDVPAKDEKLLEGLLIDITDLKRGELEFERTDTVLSTLLEHLPVGVLVEDESRNIRTVNPTLLEMFDAEMSPSDLEGRNCREMANELKGVFENPGRFLESTEDKVGTEDPTTGETLPLADGRILERDHIRYELPDGPADLWVYYDVTEERERQRLLTGLFEKSLDGISFLNILTDDDGDPIDYEYKYVNDRFEELTGLDAEGVIGKRATEVMDGIEETPFIETFGEVALGGEPIRFEQYSDPLDRHFEVSAFSPSRGECISIFSDITDRKESEQKLRERTLQLRGVLDSVEATLWMRDTDNRFLLMNQEYRELFSIGENEDIVGKHPTDLFSPETAAEFLDHDREVIEHETPIEVKKELPTERGDRTYLIRVTPLFDDDGELYATCGIATDITEHEHRKRQLQQQKEKLESFADIVSHDLRNPLQVAKGRIELAREERDSADLAAAADALDRSQALIDDLLTLAQQGVDVRDIEPLDLSDVVRTCWGHVETGDSTLTVADDVIVSADRSRLTQLLENLIANAVEHGSSDSERTEALTITVGALDDGFYLEDNGTGISESERGRVFESGYTTATGGTGFGLSIAKEIAEAHGWTIGATKGTDGGARFEISGVETLENQ